MLAVASTRTCIRGEKYLMIATTVVLVDPVVWAPPCVLLADLPGLLRRACIHTHSWCHVHRTCSAVLCTAILCCSTVATHGKYGLWFPFHSTIGSSLSDNGFRLCPSTDLSVCARVGAILPSVTSHVTQRFGYCAPVLAIIAAVGSHEGRTECCAGNALCENVCAHE